MSLWSGIKAAVYKPVRGLGRIARGTVEGVATGDFHRLRQGIADEGSAAKEIGKGVAIVNPALGAVMVGAGGLAGHANDKGGGVLKWKPVKDTLLPAAKAYAIGKLAQGFKGHFGLGGGGGTGGVASTPMADALPVTDLASATAPITAGALPATAATSAFPSIGTIAKGALTFAEKNPQLTGQIAGAAADVYGAHQEGQIQDDLQNARNAAWQRINQRRAAMGMAGY